MNIGLILSGGTGSRMGTDIPKQYIRVAGRPVISYCMEALSRHEEIDVIRIVAEKAWQELILKSIVETGGEEKFQGFSQPGENRQLSIWNALKDIRAYAAEDDLVFIHDAARPLLSGRQITDCIQAAKGHDGVMPVLPMKDTVYYSNDGKRASLLDRKCIYAG